MIDGVSGAILAGGAGTRLGGVRKGLLRDSAGKTLIEQQLALFATLFPATVIIANEPGAYDAFGVPVIADVIANRGAPAGLHAALSAVKTPWVFLAACDMPAIDARVVETLASRRRGSHASLATSGGRAEPMHAFWSVEALPVLDRLLRAGEPSFRDLLREIPHASIELEHLEQAIPGASASFANVNTPADLARFGLALPR